MGRGRSVGIATGYGLDDSQVGVRVPVGSRIFCSPFCPHRLRVRGPPSLLSNGYRRLLPKAWSWPLTSNQFRGQENVDLYIHSTICFHGLMLKEFYFAYESMFKFGMKCCLDVDTTKPKFMQSFFLITAYGSCTACSNYKTSSSWQFKKIITNN
jgi:hypothetical protein